MLTYFFQNLKKHYITEMFVIILTAEFEKTRPHSMFDLN